MQPVPRCVAEDVERIVRRDFPPGQHDLVRSMLDEYGTEKWHREEVRVRLAILKLAAGRFDEVQPHVDMAKQDYRDVLAYAEYPNYMRGVPPSEKISEAKREEKINQDWQQYQDWLYRR
jgi:hypothetical protein